MEHMDLHSPQLFDNSLAVGSSGLDEEMEKFINLLEATPVNRHVKEESPLSKQSEDTVLETGLGDCKLSAEEESLRRQQVLEKNKRAQKKFREKQKAKRVDNEKRVEELTRELHALRVEKEDMEIRFSYIMKLHQQNEVLSGKAQPEVPFDPIQGYNPESMLTFSIREGFPPVKVKAHQVAALAQPAIFRLWKEYINAFAKLLPEASRNATSPSGIRLAVLIREYAMSSICIQFGDPQKMRALMTLKMDEDCLFSELPLGTALDIIVRSLNLSGEQCVRLMFLRQELLRKLALVREQRQQTEALLQNSLQLKDSWQDQKNVFPLVCAEFLQVNEVSNSLQLNLKEDNQALFQFFCGVSSTLTAVQTASFRVQCYPYRADLVALADTVASWAGERDAGVVLRGAPQNYNNQQIYNYSSDPSGSGSGSGSH